ncbi:MAG TPA: EF-P lysine aminoacylase GenX, partial [Chromatiales bacterium]|nr:EF-P lysine aminoacylase GenX [Chromatiales bacterium]
MNWRPTASLDTLTMRARMLSRARRFFDERDVLEVDTPALGSHTASDPHIESLTAQSPSGESWFLHSSPEYRMKRLLAAGSPDIYQISHVFRGSERGRCHQPEFCMIEWYRHGLSLTDIATETCELLNALGEAASRPVDAISRYRYTQAFQETTGLDPLNCELDALKRRASRLPATSDPALHISLGDDRSAWLDLLMSHCVIPALP